MIVFSSIFVVDTKIISADRFCSSFKVFHFCYRYKNPWKHKHFKLIFFRINLLFGTSNVFYFVWKETSHKPLKVATAETFFPSVYTIGTACFHECFLFHVITERHILYKFIDTQRFFITTMLVCSLCSFFLLIKKVKLKQRSLNFLNNFFCCIFFITFILCECFTIFLLNETF